jgi:CDP-diacylglycerol--glycerol-3-phosphate 3-phosphatidyltransferase
MKRRASEPGVGPIHFTVLESRAGAAVPRLFRDSPCRRVVLAGLGLIVASSLALRLDNDAVSTGLFLAVALPTWLLASTALARARADSPPGSPLGAATHLTLGRGLLVSVVAGFLLLPQSAVIRWLPGPLYTMAAVCDHFDGYIARRLGQVSRSGARLDVAMDGLGLLAAPMVAIAWGRLPPWYVLVGAAYYLFHGGIWLRPRLGLPVYPERLRGSRTTRFFAGLQMAWVATALYPVLPIEITAPVATLIMMPTLFFFWRDWMTVIGRSHRGAHGPVPAESPGS